MQTLTITNNQSYEIVNEYIQTLDVNQTTRSGYLRAFKQFIIFLEARGKAVNNATRADVIAYRDYLLDNHKPGTVQTYLVPVKTFYKYAAAAGVYPNITEGIKSPKRSQSFKKDVLTGAQCKTVFDTIKAEDGLQAARNYALVNLLARTGLRTIEAARANCGDIRNVAGQTVLFVQGKGHTEKDEYVVLTPEAYEPLSEYLALRDNADEEAPLFISLANKNYGERMTTRSISRVCKESFKAAGIDSERITAHSLRHTAITAALLNGATVQEAQSMARHASINTTMIYAHNIDRLGNPAEAKAAAYFN